MNLWESNIHAKSAETIIEKWYQRGVNENTDFTDKFIYLWISFNAFYKASSTGNFQDYKIFLSRQKNKRDNDRNQIEYIKLIFTGAVIQGQKEINEFYDFLQKRAGDKKWGILRLDTNILKKYTDIKLVSEFLEVIYTIRNNLFHGWKNPETENDKQVLEKSSKALQDFLSIIYI